MNNNWKKFLAGTAMAAVMVLPAMVKADGVSLRVNLGEDNEAHYHFHGKKRDHHPLIFKAAKQLQNAKQTLWAAADDFRGHKAAALAHINEALDELRQAEAVR